MIKYIGENLIKWRDKMKVAILGAGYIGGIMAETIKGMAHKDIELYAVGARDIKKAEEFAQKYGIKKAYGSYEELVKDEEIDLVYIATPHSHHYQHGKLCIENGKNILCEKAFTVNEEQARELFRLAKEKNIFITEAIWTRYMPSREIINGIIKSGELGEVHTIQANLGYPIKNVERMRKPELAGGALLDLGVYLINFSMMVFGDEVKDIQAHATFSPEGIDFTDSITLFWEGGKMATLHATMLTATDRMGYIYGEEGYLAITNINNPEKIEQFDKEHRLVKTYEIPKQVSGYEYEVIASYKAIKNGKLECEEMPHEITLKVMNVMDTIRKQWGMKFPCENL